MLYGGNLHCIISHRGNTIGRDKSKENHPTQIQAALMAGFDVEIDLRFLDGKFVLGHDEGQYDIHESFLFNTKLWCHAKNVEALERMLHYKTIINCFFHDQDECCLTSNGFIWHYPGKMTVSNRVSIAVLPETIKNYDISNCYGVCTDYPVEFKTNINFKI